MPDDTKFQTLQQSMSDVHITEEKADQVIVGLDFGTTVKILIGSWGRTLSCMTISKVLDNPFLKRSVLENFELWAMRTSAQQRTCAWPLLLSLPVSNKLVSQSILATAHFLQNRRDWIDNSWILVTLLTKIDV